jgi:hypothetical protein
MQVNLLPMSVQVEPEQQGSFMTAPTRPERKRHRWPGSMQPEEEKEEVYRENI